jgi:hypothetical protein
VTVTAAAVIAGFMLSWPLKAVSDAPQAEITPGVMASEIPAADANVSN